MSTQAQISANQVNAQHSTGPRTEAGKAASAMNNFRHGLSSTFRVLRWELQEEYNQLHAALYEEHQPVTATETLLVDKMAQSIWLSKRAAGLQEDAFDSEKPECAHPRQLALYMRYQAMHDRAFHKCLNELLKLRAEKRKAEIGFESQQHKKATETRKQELHKWRVSLAEAKLDRQLSLKSTPADTHRGAQRPDIAAKTAA